MAEQHNTTVPLVGLDGKVHHIRADAIDQFRDGFSGRPLTDAEWDESKRRVAVAELADEIAGEPVQTWQSIEDWEAEQAAGS